jgi:hypothetical protein
MTMIHSKLLMIRRLRKSSPQSHLPTQKLMMLMGLLIIRQPILNKTVQMPMQPSCKHQYLTWASVCRASGLVDMVPELDVWGTIQLNYNLGHLSKSTCRLGPILVQGVVFQSLHRGLAQRFESRQGSHTWDFLARGYPLISFCLLKSCEISPNGEMPRSMFIMFSEFWMFNLIGWALGLEICSRGLEA